MKLISGRVSQNPQLVTAGKVWFAEMETNGWLFHNHINSTCSLFYLAYVEGDEVISFVVYDDNSWWNHTYEIYGAWTNPSYRQQHLYGKLFEKLKKTAKKHKISKIYSGCHKTNKISIQMQKKQGRKFVRSTNVNFFRTICEIS